MCLLPTRSERAQRRHKTAALSDDDTIASQAKEVLYGIDLLPGAGSGCSSGLAQIGTGVLIFQRNTWGLWLGVAFAA
jgi:hypothetical protein